MLAGLVPYPLRLDKGLQRGTRRFGWANLLFSIYAWAITRQSSVWEIPALAIWFLLLSLSSSALSQKCISAYYSYLDAYVKRACLVYLHSYRSVSYQRKCKCKTTQRRRAIKQANARQLWHYFFQQELPDGQLFKRNCTLNLELNAISRPVMDEGTFSRVIVFKLTTERQPPVWNNIETAQMKRPIKD